jgi:hypothetical protein
MNFDGSVSQAKESKPLLENGSLKTESDPKNLRKERERKIGRENTCPCPLNG